MAFKFSDSFSLPLLVLFLFISGKVVMGDGECYLSASPGGCPDKQKCLETCRPCYRGVGIIHPYCVAPSGPIVFWECRCAFYKGAPCPPIGGPKCPANPAGLPLSSFSGNSSTVGFNSTLV